MNPPIAIGLAAAFAAGIALAPIPAETRMPGGMPGEQEFEAFLSQQLDQANAQVQSELSKDPTTADLVSEANAVSQETAPRATVSIDKVSGVLGDEKFETDLAGWLKQADELVKDELSRDPTGMGRTR